MNKMETLLKNEKFMVSLVEMKTPEEFSEILKEADVKLEEGLTVEDAFEMVKNRENQELNDEELNDVSGGLGIGVALGAAGALALGAAGIRFLTSYAYQKYKNWKKGK